MTSITELVDKYERFRRNVLNLQASENYTCSHVRMALGSDLASRYAHIMPDGTNAYGGTQFTDQIYSETQETVKKLYGAKYAEIRPLGGHIAAEISLLCSVKKGGTIMAIDEIHGGYTGYMKGYLPEMFGYRSEIIPYIPETQEIDYDALNRDAMKIKPDAIVLGQSFFVKHYDLKRIREICGISQYLTFGLMAYVLAPVEFSGATLDAEIIFVALLGASLSGFLAARLISRETKNYTVISFFYGTVTTLVMLLLYPYLYNMYIFMPLLFLNMTASEFAWASRSVLEPQVVGTEMRSTFIGLVRMGPMIAYPIFTVISYSLTIQQFISVNLLLWDIGLAASVIWYVYGIEVARKNIDYGINAS